MTGVKFGKVEIPIREVAVSVYTVPTDPSKDKEKREEKPFWQKVFVSVCYCGGGCTLGDIIGEWGIFLLGFTIASSSLWSAYLVDFILALALGSVFQYFAIIPMRHCQQPLPKGKAGIL